MQKRGREVETIVTYTLHPNHRFMSHSTGIKFKRVSHDKCPGIILHMHISKHATNKTKVMKSFNTEYFSHGHFF